MSPEEMPVRALESHLSFQRLSLMHPGMSLPFPRLSVPRSLRLPLYFLWFKVVFLLLVSQILLASIHGRQQVLPCFPRASAKF